MPEEFEDKPDSSLDEEISAHLDAVKNPVERRTIAGLLRQLAHLPLDQTRAAIETSATIAAVSLRASIEFLRAAPAASQILEPAELHAWGEIGRRLTMTDVESGVSFFTNGVGEFARVPSAVRPFVFQVCARQMILSATTAAEAFRDAPALAVTVNNPEVLRELYEVAGSIARRSAKHSAEFLNATAQVITQLRNKRGFEALPTSGEGWGGVKAAANLSPTPLRERRGAQPLETDEIEELLASAVDLVKSFAEHAGGIAADAWISLPAAIEKLDAEQSLLLLKRSLDFLERGGAAALHVLLAGGEVLRALPEAFSDWIDLLWTITPHGNAGLVAFIRSIRFQ